MDKSSPQEDIRMVMLEDVIDDGVSLVEALEIESKKVSSDRPSKCPKCSSSKIVGVEVIGSYNGILFWECDKCDHAVLRFKEEVTEEYLLKAKELWTNPRDWGYVPRSKFN